MSYSELGPRLCKFELSGESNIYFCPRNEYCCREGCCITSTFQFYQLWWYWFMVFITFIICSGGHWWYKNITQGGCASALTTSARRSSYTRQARVAYTPARDTVVVHHLWKPSYPGMNGPPPSYSQSETSSSNGCTYSGGPKPSPYMELYGPPPSYESVIASGPAPVHLGSDSLLQAQGRSGPSQHVNLHQATPNLNPLEGRSSTSHLLPLSQPEASSSLGQPSLIEQPQQFRPSDHGNTRPIQNASVHGRNSPVPQQLPSSVRNSQIP